MHVPVLKKEIIECLDPKDSENFIDCTYGLGGHTKALLEKTKGKILAIEADPDLFKKAKPDKRVILINDSYVNLEKIIEKHNFHPIKGIIFDLGLCSWHLDESCKGFSFQRDEPLIMSYTGDLTAEQVVNRYPKKDIEDILKEYGEERFSRQIAEEIVKSRPIRTTFQLTEAVKRATPSWYHGQRIHFATRTFQALRIEVNQELENLKQGLKQAFNVLKPGARIAVISFHSLEDRIVKNFFREKHLTKKPIIPSEQEIRANPRSRSAKLRVVIK